MFRSSVVIGAALAYDLEREVRLLYGGFGADGTGLGDTWTFDVTAWHCLDRCEADR